MSATVTKQTIVDGSINLIVKIHIAGDSGGDITNSILIDADSYSPAFTDATVKNIHSTLSGFTANLTWDATTDVPLANLPDFEVNYSADEIIGQMGGIPSSAGSGATGDIFITTNGLGANDFGTIIIWLKKKGTDPTI